MLTLRGGSRVEVCSADCDQPLGEWVGGLLLVRHKGRDDLVMPLTMRCPRCGKRWYSPTVAVDDESARELLAELRQLLAERAPPGERESEAA